MMIDDRRGQIALEYMLIFAVSLILLIVFTLPLTELTVQNTVDVSDTLDIKSDLSKVAQGIKTVYGQGQGSKQSVNVFSSKAFTLNIANNYISATIKLKDGSTKNIKIDCKSNLGKSTIPIAKGENKILIEWPVGSENMGVYKLN